MKWGREVVRGQGDHKQHWIYQNFLWCSGAHYGHISPGIPHLDLQRILPFCWDQQIVVRVWPTHKKHVSLLWMRRWNNTTHHPVSWPWPNGHVHRVSLSPHRVAGRNEDWWQTNLGDTKLPPGLSSVYPTITRTQPLLCRICQGLWQSGLKKILRRMHCH